jgi:hypothetical protein
MLLAFHYFPALPILNILSGLSADNKKGTLPSAWDESDLSYVPSHPNLKTCETFSHGTMWEAHYVAKPIFSLKIFPLAEIGKGTSGKARRSGSFLE